jgi:hypothetical protein
MTKKVARRKVTMRMISKTLRWWDSGCRCQDAKKNDKINYGNSRKWLGELGACCRNHHIHPFLLGAIRSNNLSPLSF